VRKVGDGASSGEPMDFQQDKDIMHVEAPSSTTILPITCFGIHNINLKGNMIWKVRLDIHGVKLDHL
jgi:hypothetical protein